jgi:hypothetical protein
MDVLRQKEYYQIEGQGQMAEETRKITFFYIFIIDSHVLSLKGHF